MACILIRLRFGQIRGWPELWNSLECHASYCGGRNMPHHVVAVTEPSSEYTSSLENPFFARAIWFFFFIKNLIGTPSEIRPSTYFDLKLKKKTFINSSIQRGKLSKENIFAERKEKFFEKHLLSIFIIGDQATFLVSPWSPRFGQRSKNEKKNANKNPSPSKESKAPFYFFSFLKKKNFMVSEYEKNILGFRRLLKTFFSTSMSSKGFKKKLTVTRNWKVSP